MGDFPRDHRERVHIGRPSVLVLFGHLFGTLRNSIQTKKVKGGESGWPRPYLGSHVANGTREPRCRAASVAACMGLRGTISNPLRSKGPLGGGPRRNAARRCSLLGATIRQ